jgi:hypothetical protein
MSSGYLKTIIEKNVKKVKKQTNLSIDVKHKFEKQLTDKNCKSTRRIS